MQSKLNKNKIEYLLYHLNHHFKVHTGIRKKIIFDQPKQTSHRMISFPLSSKEMDSIKYVKDVAILYPLTETNSFYYFDDNKNLVFNDDLLKSAFYLLSGYQEIEQQPIDPYSRFSYKQSIQKKLNISTFPLVNEYFRIITEGIEEFCNINNIEFQKRNLWKDKKFGFLLTHDIDRVDKYSIKTVKLKLKQIIGLSKSKLNKWKLFEQLVENIVLLLKNKNPYWNFEWMKEVEKEYGLNSVWFFLPKRDPKKDAYFSFEEDRIKTLVKDLKSYGDEIGLHATYGSYNNNEILKKDFYDVKKLIGGEPKGSRQHWLRFKYPETLRLLEKTEIKYDSSWGFHDQIGWRNSYCFPFRPYDIEQDRIMDIWEFPLSVMDTTLFEYMNVDQPDAIKQVNTVIESVEKYNGLFTLLWHNSKFVLESGENLTDFYLYVLKRVTEKNVLSFVPGKRISNNIDFLNEEE